MSTLQPPRKPLPLRAAQRAAIALLLAQLAFVAGCIQSRQRFVVPGFVNHAAPTNVYEEVLGALDDADAYLKVEFKAGDFALDERARLHIAEGTEAGVWVNVDAGAVSSARVEFTQRVGLEAAAGVPMSFRELSVAANGEVDPIDLKFDSLMHRLVLSGELPKIRQLIAERVRLSTDLRALFVEGKVFAPANPPAQGSTDESVAAHQSTLSHVMGEDERREMHAAAGGVEAPVFCITEPVSESLAAIESTQSEQSSPTELKDLVVAVTARINQANLRQGSVFLLNDYDNAAATRRTRLVVGPNSSAAVPFARIVPGESSVDARIDLALSTLNSSIVTQERRFDFDSGSQLIARGLKFERTRNGWSFETPPGSGYAELAIRAGEFAIEGSNLQLGSGSSIVLYSLDLSGSSAGALEFSGSGRITLKIDSGSLHFNTLPGGLERAYLALDGGSQLVAEGILKPVQWGTDAAWRIQDGQARIDLNANEGVFDLGPAGVVLCGQGTQMASAVIDFDTTKDRNFSGSLDLLRVKDIRATLKDKAFPSELRLDAESMLLLGDGSSMVLTDAVLASSDSGLQGRLSGSLKAIGGTLKYGASTFVLADQGTRADFNNMLLDTRAKRFVSGTLEQLSCVVESTQITLGKYVKGLSLARGSKAILSPLVIDGESGRVTGALLIDAQATDGGTLAVGPGKTEFPFKAGTYFKATGLTIDSDEAAPVRGTIQAAAFTTEGGQIDLAALSDNSGGSGFTGVGGSVALGDVSFPPTEEGARGRAHFGVEDRNENVKFSGGTWDVGAAIFRLRQGSLRGPLSWEQNAGVVTFVFRPSSIEAEVAAKVAPITQTIGGDPKDVPCVLSTGKLSLSGAGTRFRFASESNSVEGAFSSPYIRHVEGVMSIECLDPVNLDATLAGSIYIPCDGGAEEGGAKTYGQTLAVGITISGGWRFAGSVAYSSDSAGTAMSLAETTSDGIGVSLLNKRLDGNDKEPHVTLVDGRQMNTVDMVVYEEDYCDRVTVRWHKGFSWKAKLANARLELAGERMALSADLSIPDKLAVKKHAPSDAGLSWDGSPRVEAGDILLKIFDFGSVSEEINTVIDSKVLPAIKSKVSKIEFDLVS
jgi:hypothetical protein